MPATQIQVVNSRDGDILATLEATPKGYIAAFNKRDEWFKSFRKASGWAAPHVKLHIDGVPLEEWSEANPDEYKVLKRAMDRKFIRQSDGWDIDDSLEKARVSLASETDQNRISYLQEEVSRLEEQKQAWIEAWAE